MCRQLFNLILTIGNCKFIMDTIKHASALLVNRRPLIIISYAILAFQMGNTFVSVPRPSISRKNVINASARGLCNVIIDYLTIR